MADEMTPDEWDGTEWVPLSVLARRHDHKGYSEEMCIRCGWVMGQIPLNCQNDDTPHRFPSQTHEIERLHVAGERLYAICVLARAPFGHRAMLRHAMQKWQEARRG